MGRSKASRKAGRVLALLAVLDVAACASARQVVAEKEDALSAAGFFVRPADTPDRAAMLRRLPPNRFVRRVQGGSVTYVYADPLVCDCLYVGSELAWNTYRRDRMQQRLVGEQMLATETYSDAAWNWGAWAYPGFGFGPGPGWSPAAQ